MRMPIRAIFAATLALTAASCTDDAPPKPASGGADPSAARAPQAGGMIEVVVKYLGEPVVETLEINKDVEACGTDKQLQKFAVGPDHGLRDAVVALAGWKGEPTARTGPRPTLDQKRCEFHPRVLAMMPGELDILNSDGILHNIHTSSQANAPINKAQPRFRKVITESFDEPERIRVRCDVHSWMEGWIVILPHPYFGVTDYSGGTKIQNVPPGKHTIEVWYPALGSHRREVAVKDGQTSTVTFEIKG